MNLMTLIATIGELQARLEGAAALNIYLLNKLGGQLTITKGDMEAVIKDFDTLNFAAKDDQIVIKLGSTGEVAK